MSWNYKKMFGRRLRELRKAGNLSQEKLAEMMGLSPNTIGMIERGNRTTTVEKAFRFALALQVDVGELFKNLY